MGRPPTDALVGDIAELIVFPRVVVGDELDAVRAYLSRKYDVPYGYHSEASPEETLPYAPL